MILSKMMMKDIAKLPTFTKKRILIVVAHPDDECLYFYGGLKVLAAISSVTILSVTHSALMARGMELRSFCKSMDMTCDFLSLPDRGFHSTLPDFQKDLDDYLLQNDFNFIITHPPHGGEKPHPHHLQTMLTVLSHCLRHQVKFAFFSENQDSLCEPTRIESLMTIRMGPLVKLYAVRTTLFLNWKYKIGWLRLVFKNLFKIAFQFRARRKLFIRFQIHSPPTEKKKSFHHYMSQREVLDSYKTASSDTEYLFLLTGFRMSKDGSSIGTDTFIKDYHEFKTSTAFRSGLG